MNATTAKSKISVMERKLHKIVLSIFVAQLMISIFAGFGRPMLLLMRHDFNYRQFIRFVTQHDNNNYTDYDNALVDLTDGFRYFLLLSTLIPISLVVSLEIVRLLQSVLTRLNYELHCQKRNIPCKVNTSTVNEELGQIEFILSDKTGTLTQNKMALQGVYIADQVFGGEFSKVEGKVNFESFSDKQKRNMKRILTELDERFDHSMHNIMQTQTSIRLKKPLMITNPTMQGVEDKSFNRSTTDKKLKNYDLILQNSGYDTPQKLTLECIGDPALSERGDSDKLRPLTPRDGIFSESTTPLPRVGGQFFFNSPEKQSPQKLSRAVSGFQLPRLVPPISKVSDNESNLDDSDMPMMLKSPSANLTKKTNESRRALFPQIVISREKEVELPNMKHLTEPSLLSENESSVQSWERMSQPIRNFEGATFQLNSYQDVISEFFLCASLCHQCIVEVHIGDRSYQGPSPDEIAICRGAKMAGCEFIGTSSEGISEVKLFGKSKTFKMKMEFPFDSNRKRHSIILKDNGIYKVYVKGADSSMIPFLSKHTDHPYLEKTKKALDDFSNVGLRTLIFGCRFLTSAQYQHIEKLYTEAISSVDKKEKLKRLASLVESDLVLLGCTAIKDHLQDKVPEAITRFIEARIKVWMITGDKLLTAESIAHSAGIFQSDMKIFYLDYCTKDTFLPAVLNLKKKMQRVTTSDKRGIIIDVSMNSRPE